jgi:hypothetical protein
VRQQIRDTARHGVPDRILEFVDRRADGDHQRVRRGDVVPAGGSKEVPAGERLPQQRFPALFEERKPAVDDRADGGVVDVVDERAETLRGEHRRQRRADVAGAADHTNVVGGCGHGP